MASQNGEPCDSNGSAMTENAAAIPLPTTKRFRRPPKALWWMTARCLIWAAWTVICVINSVKHGGLARALDIGFMLLYVRWMIRDYRILVGMVEAWLDDKLVKMPPGIKGAVLLLGPWTVLWLTLTLLN